jgi:ribonucleoside-triphosphate reductase
MTETNLSLYQEFIHKSRYARYLDEKKRRETWEETVSRYVGYWQNKYPEYPAEEIYQGIISMGVMPSMRALMTAGPALDKDNVAGYNCSYLVIDSPRAFDEILYILMCGTGVGFSVERQDISKLPAVAESHQKTDTCIVVRDSKTGWATAFRELIALLYQGAVPDWDLSKLRAKGARLKTFGGRSSGPEPLNQLFLFTRDLFTRAAGRKLNSLECHDLVCKIADVVVVGGVRRSALISLSNLTDARMRAAKNGQWWEGNGQRALANNSVAYTESPDMGIFMEEWLSLYQSRSGERGIFNRNAAKLKSQQNGRRDTNYEFGTNPCGEIILRPKGFCNLSEVVVRAEDDLESLKKKVRVATIIGTFQSTLVSFRYLRSDWRKNAEEERLPGVSLTGIMDNATLTNAPEQFLQELRDYSIQVNKEWSEKLGIPQSAAITTVKPSGTVSQLVNSGSGIHPRYSKYYIRTVRNDAKDPLTAFLISQGVPSEVDVTNPGNVVFSFPIKSPEGSVTREEMGAIAQLEHYLVFAQEWCEHNPSITVYVKENEWLEVAAWVYKNFDYIGGVSFLPHSDHIYQQAPYQEITKEAYEEFVTKMPTRLDWSLLKEEEDNVMSYKELACLGGVCEI